MKHLNLKTMTNTIIKTIIIIALPLLISSCYKKPKPVDYNSLPEYFECLINGKYFTYNNERYPIIGNGKGLKATIYSNGINIFAQAKSGGQCASGVDLSIQDFNNTNNSIHNIVNMNLGFYSSEGTASVSTFEDSPNETLQTDSTHNGIITFTKNTDSLIEGTFYFKAITQSGFVAEVSNGKFKIKI
jgi:hypothetical protein